MEVQRDDLGDALLELGDHLLELVFSVAGNLVIIMVLLFISRFIRRRIHAMAERRGMRNNVPALFDNVVRAVVYTFIGILLLSLVGIKSSSLLTFFSLATAALTLSLQDVLKNLFSGLYILAEQPFAPGDRIRVSDEDGRVERIDLRVTRIRNDRNELILVPNSTVFTQVVGARSTMGKRPMTVQITGIQQEDEEAAQMINEVLAELIPGGNPAAVRPLRLGPIGCDLEVTIQQTASDQQQLVILRSLRTQFPDASISVISR